MSLDETKINKLPLINSSQGASLTKYENFKKSPTNIFLSQLRKNYYSTLRSISLKKSGMNISTDNKKSNFRSTSLNTNKTAILKRNQNSKFIICFSANKTYKIFWNF